ncbi:MAG: glycerol-3-phosphate acyltransferase [Elainellaceae cyanobacterium]
MTPTQIWGVLLIFILCPLLGGLPLIDWISYAATHQRLSRVGTGNVGVSAAFYHGGPLVGTLAVFSEALKGIAAVLLARSFFPTQSAWEIIALIALVMGRYWMGRGAGTTNVVWGYVVHDWVTAGLVLLIGGIGFTLLRERQLGKLGVLVLLPVITALRYPEYGALIGANVTLSILLGWIYQKIPDDLDLSTTDVQAGSKKMFRFFRGDRALLTLNQPLKTDKVGQKATNLAQLKQWGFPVPSGWVLPPGDDPQPLIEAIQPSPDAPVIVRSSAIGEDSETASAAGQYESILNVTSQAALERAILHCQASYSLPSATRYRQDQGIAEAGIAVIVQEQIQGLFSGVAFSRDPVTRQGDAVIIEALPGMATRVVSGQFTPERYRVWIQEERTSEWKSQSQDDRDALSESWKLSKLPDHIELEVEGEGEVPIALIQQVALLTRSLEHRYHGIPQDLEWTYDGQQIWILQARPITTLSPIWTRKIAAEVIPGFIHPLTWSINRPLTCGVWGDIFTTVLGKRAAGLDFNETATLHNSAAYFNASLLGRIFRLMGLPPESLEFLTRGAKFSKPPLRSTLRNIPGLLRLVRQEWRLEQEFDQAMQDYFEPGLLELTYYSPDQLPPEALLKRIYRILRLLKQATYYSIMAPLSAALRKALFRVPEQELDNRQTPEVASVRSLQALATNARYLLPNLTHSDPQVYFSRLEEIPEGRTILQQFHHFLETYGYLSEVATDVAVPTWKEDPKAIQELFTQFLLNSSPETPETKTAQPPSWKVRQVQRRLDLKGRVTATYSRLLAELRWSFVALEQHWQQTGLLSQPGDIFFLTFEEIEQIVTQANPQLEQQLVGLIQQRRSTLEHDRQAIPPMLVYGDDPPTLAMVEQNNGRSSEKLRGIGASPGQVEGHVKVMRNLQGFSDIRPDTILVVPHTDSGWAPLLAQVSGLISEVGGQLSHGAIVAREYRIPAVMDIHQATQILSDGQRVRIDGQSGVVEILRD